MHRCRFFDSDLVVPSYSRRRWLIHFVHTICGLERSCTANLKHHPAMKEWSQKVKLCSKHWQGGTRASMTWCLVSCSASLPSVAIGHVHLEGWDPIIPLVSFEKYIFPGIAILFKNPKSLETFWGQDGTDRLTGARSLGASQPERVAAGEAHQPLWLRCQQPAAKVRQFHDI